MLQELIVCSVIVGSFMMMSISAQIYAHGIVLRDDEFTCNRTGPQCSEDCTTLMLCAAELTTPFANVSCAKSSPSTPYCLGNTCSASPGNCTSSSAFRCTGAGVFPDPTDCTRYRHCEESNAESKIFVCPAGFQFNSKINICELGKSNSKFCNIVDCSQKSNEIVVYRANAAYFAFCFVDPTGIRETIMFKCEFEQFEIYDPAENKCKFNCKSAGYFQDPVDCSSYYVCTAAALGTYKSERIQCPSTYYFDGTKCTKDSSNCSPESLGETSIT